MQADELDDFDDFDPPAETTVDWRDRPTIPVPPCESGVQLAHLGTGQELSSAMVDVVLCDLSRDPRSEDFVDDPQRAERTESAERAERGERDTPRVSIFRRRSAQAVRFYLPTGLDLDDVGT